MTICIQSQAHLSAVLGDLERLWSAEPEKNQDAADAAEYLEYLCEGQQFPLLLDLTNLPSRTFAAITIALANVRELAR